MKSNKILLFLVIALSAASIISVPAAAQSFWDAIFGPFAGIGTAYDRYTVLMDFIIYLIIFIGVAQFTIGKVVSKGMSSGKSSNAVVFGFAFMMALALSLWESQAGFNIKSFGPVAMAILVGVAAAAFYKALKAHGVETATAFAWGYVLAFMALSALGIYSAIIEGQQFYTLGQAMMLILGGCIIVIALRLLKKMKALGGGGGGGLTTPTLTPTPTPSGTGGGEIPGAEEPGAPPGGAKLTPDEEEKAGKGAEEGAEKAGRAGKRAEAMAILEEKELEEVIKKMREFINYYLGEIRFDSKHNIEATITNAAHCLYQIHEVLQKLERQEGRELRFSARVRSFAERVQKNLHELGDDEKAKVLKHDTEIALAYGIQFEEKLKAIFNNIESWSKVIDDIREKKDYSKYSGQHAVSQIREEGAGTVLSDLNLMHQWLVAIIKLDEDIKRVEKGLEPEAKAAEEQGEGREKVVGQIGKEAAEEAEEEKIEEDEIKMLEGALLMMKAIADAAAHGREGLQMMKKHLMPDLYKAAAEFEYAEHLNKKVIKIGERIAKQMEEAGLKAEKKEDEEAVEYARKLEEKLNDYIKQVKKFYKLIKENKMEEVLNEKTMLEGLPGNIEQMISYIKNLRNFDEKIRQQLRQVGARAAA